MIDFACKEFSLDEVVKCGLGLTKADFRILKFLIENEDDWFTTENISKKTRFNLSTVQKTMKRLAEKDVVERKQNNIDGGGYFFIYKLRDKTYVRKVIMKTIKNWTRRVEKELDIL